MEYEEPAYEGLRRGEVEKGFHGIVIVWLTVADSKGWFRGDGSCKGWVEV